MKEYNVMFLFPLLQSLIIEKKVGYNVQSLYNDLAFFPAMLALEDRSI